MEWGSLLWAIAGAVLGGFGMAHWLRWRDEAARRKARYRAFQDMTDIRPTGGSPKGRFEP
jgi:hypothetical protein